MNAYIPIAGLVALATIFVIVAIPLSTVARCATTESSTTPSNAGYKRPRSLRRAADSRLSIT